MRKSFAATAALTVLLTSNFAHADNICGDVNDSASITASDALAVLQRAVGQPNGLTCGPPGETVRTGQLNDFGPSSDGAVRAGSVRSFTDNGDGTITDFATGLMWEKKHDSIGVHDKDAVYTWSTSDNQMNGSIQNLFLGFLNIGDGFAGYNDWRIPNRFELETLLNLSAQNPATFGIFLQDCNPGCVNCSCTESEPYFTSSSGNVATTAWVVNFATGAVSTVGKTTTAHARAVRNAPNLETFPTCQLPDPPQCTQNDPCSNGVCSVSRESCAQPGDCPLSPGEQCCCAGICL